MMLDKLSRAVHFPNADDGSDLDLRSGLKGGVRCSSLFLSSNAKPVSAHRGGPVAEEAPSAQELPMAEFESSRFGTITVNEESVITFPKGLVGFEECTRYHLYHEEGTDQLLYYLQSLDDADVVFTLANPEQLGIDYQLSISDEEAETIKLSSPDQLAIMLMVYRPLVPAGEESVEEQSELKAQARSPLLINTAERLAMQKIGLRARLVFSNLDDETELQLKEES